MNPEQSSEVSKRVNTRKILIPVLFGIGISLYLIYTNFDPKALANITVSQKLVFGLFLALASIIVRDFAFLYKIRLSAGKNWGWYKSLQVILMWEFGAAITPKVTEMPFTLFVLKRSGLSYGRSVAVVLLNAFLDNAIFVVVFAILYLSMGSHILFVSTDCNELAGDKLMLQIIQEVRHLADKAWIGYAIFCGAASFFGIALFFLPKATKKFLYRIGEFKFVSRFKDSFRHLGDEIEITAKEYKTQKASFWIRMTVATLFNWTGRYLLINALVFAFSTITPNMFEVYARQYLLWMFLAIPTTPGASGWAEISFIALNCEFIPVGLSAALALIWRIYSYYIYLVLGIFILPRWLANTAKH